MIVTDQNYRMLDVLCPMHVVVQADGLICHAGPTAKKLTPGKVLKGKKFTAVFETERPRKVSDVQGLVDLVGSKLHMRLRNPPHKALKGVVVQGPGPGELTLNLSFGISVVDAVQYYGLTAADFASTDLTIEMLYLVEAKSAAMEASRHLNSKLQAAREEAEEQAFTDALTGLKNRRAMDFLLDGEIEARAQFTLMHIDLDYFKAVNDTFGHAAGDFVLTEVAKIMSEEIRKSDTLARVGGDEFVVLLGGPVERNEADLVATRIIARLAHPIVFEDNECRIAASVGIVQASDYRDPTADQLLKDADTALYRSKTDGRGRHTFFSDLPATSRETCSDEVGECEGLPAPL